MRPELIPVYGLFVASSDYMEIIERHKIACAKHSRNPTPENYRETWEWFDKSWPASARVLIAVYVTAGTMVVCGIGAVIVFG